MRKEVENKTIIIKNPSEKMKAFIKKMEEDKISRRQELLKSGNCTFTIWRVNLSFSKQIREGDTVVVSLCSYYADIESVINTGFGSRVELINIDIVRENGESSVPLDALSDICRTLTKILDDTPEAVAYYFCDYITQCPVCAIEMESLVRVTETACSNYYSRSSRKTPRKSGKTGKWLSRT